MNCFFSLAILVSVITGNSSTSSSISFFASLAIRSDSATIKAVGCPIK